MLYLDNAATSLKKPLCVAGNMFLNTLMLSANAGRGGHYYSILAMEKLMETAELLSGLFNADNPLCFAFLQNATLALNMAISGIADGGHIVITQMEHNSVLRPVHAMGNYTVVNADSEGFVNPCDIEKAVRYDTRLIVCTHASNVCGSIQAIEKVGEIAKKYDIPFLVDAAQTAGIVDIDVKKMNISLLAFSGHKGLMGPLGTGGLYVREDIKLKPIISGGTGSKSESPLQPDFMPDMLHSGTLNTPAVASLGSSIKFINRQTTGAILDHERYLAWRFINELKNMSGVTVYGSDDITKRNGTVCFNIDKLSSGAVSEILNDDYYIAVRGGWHCAYPAHKAIGTEKSGAVRASFGYFNKKKDVERIVDAVGRIARGNF